jgi:outer membrane biosynthesis protein TonB
VKVLVNEEGRVIKISSLSGNDVFYDEVRENVYNLEFTPGLQNGKAVKVWVSVPFNFRLKDK